MPCYVPGAATSFTEYFPVTVEHLHPEDADVAERIQGPHGRGLCLGCHSGAHMAVSLSMPSSWIFSPTGKSTGTPTFLSLQQEVRDFGLPGHESCRVPSASRAWPL